MTTTHTEVERKYAADDVELPPLTSLLGPAEKALSGSPVVDGDVVHHDLAATYFDTGDLRLAAAGLTLRRRTGGDDAGWHLKVPAAAGARSEVRLPLGRAVKTVPKALRQMVRAHTRDEPLRPVAGVTTDRTVRRLVDATGRVLVEMADDHVTARRLLSADDAAGDPSSAVSWREVEVELVEGPVELMEHLDSALRERGLRDAPSASKLRQALGADGDAAVAAARPESDLRLRRRSPAGDVVRAYVCEQVAQIRRQDLPVRLDAPDSVHKMRVACRRLRSALSTFRPVYDRDVTDPLRQELKWLAGELGAARDAEVMRDRLHVSAAEEHSGATDGGAVSTVDSELGDAYRAAHDRLLAEMDGDRYHALLRHLDDLVEHPPLSARASRPARKVLPRRVSRSWSDLRSLMKQAQATAKGTERDEVLHEARKAAKRARYAAEAVAPAFGTDAKVFADAMEELQEVLGERQDSVVTRARLLELADAAPTHRAAFAYGRLHALEEVRAEQGEESLAVTWDAARRKSLRRWLG